MAYRPLQIDRPLEMISMQTLQRETISPQCSFFVLKFKKFNATLEYGVTLNRHSDIVNVAKIADMVTGIVVARWNMMGTWWK